MNKVKPRIKGETAIRDGVLTPEGVKAINAATPGGRTTEFWLSLAVIACALVLTLFDKISGEVGMGAITAAGVGYSVARGIAKG